MTLFLALFLTTAVSDGASFNKALLGARWAVPQSTSSQTRYFLKEDRLWCADGDTLTPTGPSYDFRYHRVFQVDHEAIVVDSQLTDILTVYSKASQPKTIKLSRVVVDPILVCRFKNRYVVGNLQNDVISLYAFNPDGTLQQEWSQSFTAKQHLYTRHTLSAVSTKDQLDVFLPRSYQVFRFGPDLKLLEAIDLVLPADLTEYQTDTFENMLTLHESGRTAEFESFATEHQGKIFSVKFGVLTYRDGAIHLPIIRESIAPAKNGNPYSSIDTVLLSFDSTYAVTQSREMKGVEILGLYGSGLVGRSWEDPRGYLCYSF